MNMLTSEGQVLAAMLARPNRSLLELSKDLSLSYITIYRAIKKLREMGLVRKDKEGRLVTNSATPDALELEVAPGITLEELARAVLALKESQKIGGGNRGTVRRL